MTRIGTGRYLSMPGLLLCLSWAGGCDGLGATPRMITYDGIYCSGMWTGLATVNGQAERLEYMVFYTGASLPITSSMDKRIPPGSRGLSIHPKGLFLNGARVEVSPGSWLFVWDGAESLKPLVLDKGEMAEAENSIHTQAFFQGRLWKEKIVPTVKGMSWGK